MLLTKLLSCPVQVLTYREALTLQGCLTSLYMKFTTQKETISDMANRYNLPPERVLQILRNYDTVQESVRAQVQNGGQKKSILFTDEATFTYLVSNIETIYALEGKGLTRAEIYLRLDVVPSGRVWVKFRGILRTYASQNTEKLLQPTN